MKRSRFISNIRYPSVHISEGSIWIRQLKVSKINHPLIIQVVKKMDKFGKRYIVHHKQKPLYFDRETIVENYEPRTAPELMTTDWQIAEVKGYRFYQSENEIYVRGNYDGAPDCPASLMKSYVNNFKKAEELLVEMADMKPEFRNHMGSIELLLRKDGKVIGFKDKTKPSVISRAYLELFS